MCYAPARDCNSTSIPTADEDRDMRLQVPEKDT